MKTRNILTFIVAAVIFSSCSVSLQQRRVADELYQNPNAQPEKEQIYAGYYDETEKILGDESQDNVDSVVYETKDYENPYDKILVDDYDEAYQRRIDASTSLSYGMSDWYSTYYSDDFWYASAYEPSFYNVIVMGDETWVEPNWLTNHFSTGWKYGRFYNYPYYGQSYMNPYGSSLSMTGIYGFNSMGYGTYGYNAYGYNPYGYSSFGYSPYGYSSFGYGYGSYYGFSPYYYYSSSEQQRIDKDGNITKGRTINYSNPPQRVRRTNNSEKNNNDSKSFIRVSDRKNSNNNSAVNVNSERTRRSSEQSRVSRYVRTSDDNASSKRPRYNRPENEANFEKVKQERSRNVINNSSERKRSSTYRNSGNSNTSVSSTRSSRSGSSKSSSSGSSSSSSSSGRKRK